jgi:hypothetical protein
MMIYLGKARGNTLSCKAYSSLLRAAFDIKEQPFCEYSSEPVTRRELLAVVRGVASLT